MSGKKDKILFLAGSNFNSAYSGTLYLVRSLINLNFDLEIILFADSKDTSNYKEFNSIKIFSKQKSIPVIHKLVTFFRLSYVFFRLLNYEIVFITEGNYLVLSRYIKVLRPSVKIVQYCQELWYQKDHPWSKQAALFDKHSRIPDIVIDVEVNRASIRQKLFGLQNLPFVLLNTLPFGLVPSERNPGSLANLIGANLPSGIPILIYTGGVGIEKPFERLLEILSHVRSTFFFLAILNIKENELLKYEESAKYILKNTPFKVTSSLPREKIIGNIWEADIGIIDYTYSVQPTYNQKYCAPTKLFEYMASGLAIAGSNNDSLRSIIEYNKIGFCANNDSVSDFADKIDLLLSHKDELNLMKERSYELFRNKYCYEKINYPVINEVFANLSRKKVHPANSEQD
jgi:glycosyltransferase involved in cell wall biosynthesis